MPKFFNIFFLIYCFYFSKLVSAKINDNDEINDSNVTGGTESKLKIIPFLVFIDRKKFIQLTTHVDLFKTIYKVQSNELNESYLNTELQYSKISKKLHGVTHFVEFIKQSHEDVFGFKSHLEKPDVNSIIWENILKILEAVPKNKINLLTDTRFLMKILLRSDLLLSNDEFKKLYYDVDVSKLQPSSEFIEIRQEKAILGKHSCKATSETCDRRQFQGSCENLLSVLYSKQCPNTWIIAALHHLSYSHCINTAIPSKYSIQELVDCIGNSCSKGSYKDVLSFLLKNKHLSLENDYPFNLSDNNNGCDIKNKFNSWTGILRIDSSTNTVYSKESLKLFNNWKLFLKRIISTSGSVIFYTNANNLRYQMEPIKICNNGKNENIAAVITGWTKYNGKDVWIVRNSWGQSWGDNGYGYIYMDSDCKDNEDPIFLIDFAQHNWSDKIDISAREKNSVTYDCMNIKGNSKEHDVWCINNCKNYSPFCEKRFDMGECLNHILSKRCNLNNLATNKSESKQNTESNDSSWNNINKQNNQSYTNNNDQSRMKNNNQSYTYNNSKNNVTNSNNDQYDPKSQKNDKKRQVSILSNVYHPENPKFIPDKTMPEIYYKSECNSVVALEGFNPHYCKIYCQVHAPYCNKSGNFLDCMHRFIGGYCENLESIVVTQCGEVV